MYPALAVAAEWIVREGPAGTSESPGSVLWLGGRGGMEADLVGRAGLPFQAISASGGQLIFRLRRDARIDVDRLIRYVSTRAGAAFSPTGVLSLELPAGQSVIDAARAVLAELAA